MTTKMSRAGLARTMISLTLVVACEPEQEQAGHRDDAAGDEHPAPAAAAHAHDDHATGAIDGTDVVRVAPEMLRDLRVTTTKVERRAAGDGVALLGALRVNDDAYAEVASAIPARVRTVSVGLGDRVRVGQALATIESAEVGRARADLLHARARADLASAAVERKRPLAADNVVPQRELHEAEAEVSAARAALQAARAALVSFGVPAGEVDATVEAGGVITLDAPIDGTIIERRAVRGARVDADDTLFRIADERRLWLVVHAFERDAVRIETGTEASVTFPALPGATFRGKVSNVGREVEPSSRTIAVRIDVGNDVGTLRSGMSATAWVPLGDSAGAPVVVVPARALQRNDRDWVVFQPVGDAQPGAFAVRRVGRGRDLGGDVEIVGGLAPDDEVVVEGAFLLKAEMAKATGGGEEHPH